MIKVKIEKQNAKYKKITMLGHAMYDDYGKDIVCSAASSIVTTTVNGILSLNKGSLSYMVSLLKELENNYPENIEVK